MNLHAAFTQQGSPTRLRELRNRPGRRDHYYRYNIVEYPPYVWNPNLDKKIINIDFTEAEVDKYYNPDIDIAGDISRSLMQLGGLIAPRGNDQTFAAVRRFLDRKLAF